MNKDNRVSNLPEILSLSSDQVADPFPHQAKLAPYNNADDDALLLITRSGSHNEQIKFRNFKKSVLENSVYLTGNQLISGEKTFADTCTFESTIYINEIIDITQTGDISGNIFVGESGLFEKIGIGLDFTDRRIVKDTFSAYPNRSGEDYSFSFGGGIDPNTYSGALDFSGGSQPNLETTTSSYSIYEPSGYYNSTIPLSQQNWNTGTSLDGHSLSPSDLHREMGGAWLQVDFDKPFNYKGFSIHRASLGNSAEKAKVLASEDGLDWTTIHRVTGLTSGDYQDPLSPSSFFLNNYHPQPYSKYRLVAEKVISGNKWEINHFSFSGVEFFDHVHTVNPLYTLHVSGDSCFLGDITNTGYHRQEGDFYRVGDSDFSGDYSITGDSTRVGDVRMEGDYRLTGDFTQTGYSNRYGDQLVIGDITHTGYHRQKGDFYRIGESNFVGDFSVTGDSLMVGDVKTEGNYYLTGDFTQTGNSTIFGDERVTGDVHIGEYIYHYQDEDTFIKLDEDQISLTAGGDSEILISESDSDFISFSTSGEEQMRIDNSGFVGINTVDTLGELSVTGSSYLEKAYTTGEDGRWERIFGGSDEVVSFVASLNKGSDNFYLDFPKTFGEKPALTLSLENSQGGPIVPYMISDLNEFRFAVNFGSELQNDNYKLHVNARPTGQSSANKTTTQSFATDIPEGVDSFEVQYPCSFHAIPSISTVIESEGIMIPYLVSGVSRDSYHIILSSLSKSGSRIHTHAVR